MDSECPILRPINSNLPVSFSNVVNKEGSQMDLVSSPTDSIVINSESSKDDSVSSCEDATGGRENGIDASSKKPTITLAKSVTLKNFSSMKGAGEKDNADSISESKETDDNADESLVIDTNRETDTGPREPDPLSSSIVLSESDGEGTNDGAANTPQPSDSGNVESESTDSTAQPSRLQLRLHVSVPSTEDDSNTVVGTSAPGTNAATPSSDNSIVEILSEDNNSTPKKQVKVLVPSSKKTSDGTVPPVKIPPELKDCINCGKSTHCVFKLDFSGSYFFLCSDRCMVENRFAQKAALQRAFTKPVDPSRPVITRKCGECKEAITISDNILSWETMDFCNENCLKQYQNKLGLQCSYCKQQCQEQSLGKYCVRFGFDIRQFCHSNCLEDYKKGIKVCSFCQEDIPNNQGFMAAINDKQHFKEFCSEDCMTDYDKMSNNQPVRLSASSCDVCRKTKLISFEVVKGGKTNCICSDVCFNAFKFVNPKPMGFCDMCRKHFDTENSPDLYYTFVDEAPILFCSKTCMNAYVIFKRKIVQCNWCKVKKYNFDMIKKIFSNRQVMMLCSFYCFSMWKQSPKRNTCDHCKTFGQIQYHLGMSDGTLRSFCGHECLMKFQLQFKKVPVTPSSARPVDSSATVVYPVNTSAKVPQITGKPTCTKKTSDNTGVIVTTPSGIVSVATICAPPSRINDNTATIPVISSVTSLEPSGDTTKLPEVSLPVTVNTPKTIPQRKPVSVLVSKANVAAASTVVVKQQLLLVPPPPVSVCNKSTLFISGCPATKCKGTLCRPFTIIKSTQTNFDSDEDAVEKISLEDDDSDTEDKTQGPDENKSDKKIKPVKKVTIIKEVPVVIPVPLPIYIPVPIPMYSVPTPTAIPVPVPVPICLPTPHENHDQLLKHIQELCSKLPEMASGKRRLSEGNDLSFDLQPRSKKKCVSIEEEVSEASGSGNDENRNKRRKLNNGGSQDGSSSGGGGNSDGDDSHQGQNAPGGSGSGDGGHQPPTNSNESFNLPPSPPKKYIQYVFGVNAWKKWVSAKNEELSKEDGNNKQFGTELLHLSSDELCESLTLFVTEFKKPSGQSYSADVLYYLVLGIQEYLSENGREDKIFTDTLYDKFTDTFDDIISKESLHDNSEFLVPRIEEEHLWESHQLGVYSPFALLLTMLYNMTKAFFITDVDSHMNLAFSHLMKQWPRGQSSGEKQVNKYSCLRYFPPNQSKGDTSKDSSNQDSKKKCELIEDRDNPMRCPVTLYHYYISKCPETVRNRSDIFYLQPERSYLADSPVWYTTEPLDRNLLTKMFNRLRLVKEVSLVLNSDLSNE